MPACSPTARTCADLPRAPSCPRAAPRTLRALALSVFATAAQVKAITDIVMAVYLENQMYLEQLEYMQRLRLMRTWLGTSRCIADPAIVFFFPAMPKPGHHPGGQEEPALLPIPAKLLLQPEPGRGRVRWADAEGQPLAREAGAHAQVLGVPKAPPLPPKGWRPEKLSRSQLDQGQGYSNAGLFVARAARRLGHC